MLLFRSHWHIAFERDPFGEARLLRKNASEMDDDELRALIASAVNEGTFKTAEMAENQKKIREDILSMIDEFRDEINGMIQSGKASGEALGSNEQRFAERLLAYAYSQSPELEEIFREMLTTTEMERDERGQYIYIIDPDRNTAFPKEKVTLNAAFLTKIIGARKQIASVLEAKKNDLLEQAKQSAQSSVKEDPNNMMSEFLETKDVLPGEKKILEEVKRNELLDVFKQARKEKLLNPCAEFTKNTSRDLTTDEVVQKFRDDPSRPTADKALIDEYITEFNAKVESIRINLLKEEFAQFSLLSDGLNTKQKIRAFMAQKTAPEKALIQLHLSDFEEIAPEPNPANKPALRLSAELTCEKAENLSRKISGMREQLTEIFAIAAKFPVTPESQKDLEELRKFDEQLQSQSSAIRDTVEITQKIRDWRSGNIAPNTFLEWLETQRTNGATNTPIAQGKRLVASTAGRTSHTTDSLADMTNETQWGGQNYANISDKLTAIETVESFINTQIELSDADTFLNVLDKTLKDDEKKIDVYSDIQNILEAMQKMEKELEQKGGKGITIEWYSIMDFVNGAKGWWERYAATWEKRAKIRQGRIQNKVSNVFTWLPYGQEAARESEKELDGVHREQRGKWKEQLEEAKPKFIELFGDKGEFSESLRTKDIDRTMAIMEYGASHGWLYELRDLESINGHKIVQFLPGHWDEHRRAIYLDNLIGENESGFDKEISSTASSIAKKYDDKYDYIQKELDVYLDQINIPAAMGAMQTMYDRAIDGDEGSHIAVHFFNTIRTNAVFRRYMTPTMLQKIGRISTGKAAFTMTNVWADRKNLSAISKNPGKDISLEDMKDLGNLASAIANAEKLVREQSGEEFESERGKSKLNEYVANIISGNTVLFPKTNVTVSMWSNDKIFKKYRDGTNSVHAFVGAELAAKTDTDYFASKKAELVLASENFYSGVFKMESQGSWQQHEKARLLLKDIKSRYDALLKAHPAGSYPRNEENPAEIFRKEVGAKIQKAISTNLNRTDQIIKYTIPGDEQGADEINAIAWLAGAGFIDLQKLGDGDKVSFNVVPPNVDAEIIQIANEYKNVKVAAQRESIINRRNRSGSGSGTSKTNQAI